MICIALVLLLHCCLFGSSGYTFKVSAPEFVQLDLFDTLHLHNSTYQGVSLGTGVHTLSPGVVFTGDFREIMISGEWLERIRGHFSQVGANEFTISAIVKQNADNVGTLLSFSKGLFRALEIQSSGRKNELRVSSGLSVETFPYRLADGKWHRLAISFSASQVDILVDCSPLYRRVLKFDPATAVFDSSNISVWIGQRTTSHFLYQGVMQDLRLTFGPYGYLSQCPQMDSQCPTCSGYTALKMSFATLQSQLQILTERLNRAESRLSNVEQCDCQKQCRVNNTSIFGDGSTWHQNCDICSCKRGVVECHRMECPKTTCKSPITRPGECCPMCLKQCFFRGSTYDHGEVEAMKECVDCECNDGSMQCKRRDPEKTCPILSCQPSEQVTVPGECCKVCRGADYCASHGHRCHSNATCVNLQTTFLCQCKDGFSGDGNQCEDLDECLLDKNHCARNTICVNNLGDYSCECLVGYERLNPYQCEDVNECADGGSNKCHSHATCENTKGNYTCTCNSGYSGDGFHCTPICNRTCENGGICTSPDVCSCRSGWTGPQCETDFDECQDGNNNIATARLCPPNAKCVNKPGWYLCQCEEGFEANLSQHHREAGCQDIDECANAPCPNEMKCVNTVGSYECHCTSESGHDCSSGCIANNGKKHMSGSTWFDDECKVCTCTLNGTVTCHHSSHGTCSQLCPLENNLIGSGEHSKCCDNCGLSNNSQISNVNKSNQNISLTNLKKSCFHQIYPDIKHKSGDVWHYQCQTCECLDGEVDCWPMDCPPLNCRNPILPPGDCCYRCPDDQCTHTLENSTISRDVYSDCQVLENTIDSGTQVSLPTIHCISCKCQDGELCCTYDYDCLGDTSSSRPSDILTTPSN